MLGAGERQTPRLGQVLFRVHDRPDANVGDTATVARLGRARLLERLDADLQWNVDCGQRAAHCCAFLQLTCVFVLFYFFYKVHEHR